MSKLIGLPTLIVACALATAVGCGDDDDNSAGQGGYSGSGARGGTGGRTGGTGGTGAFDTGGSANNSGGRSNTGGRVGTGGQSGGSNQSGGGGQAGGGEAGAGAADTGGSAGSGGASGMGAAAGEGGGGAGAGGEGGQGGEGGAFSSTQVQALSDSQILLVVDTLNAGEVEEAYAALPRLSDAGVEAFARRMITDHGQARLDTATLATTLDLSPKTSDVQAQLEEMAMQERQELLDTSNAAIDRVYIEAQIADHAEALALLQILQPAADAAQLKQFITTLEADVQAHYTLAVTTRDALQ